MGDSDTEESQAPPSTPPAPATRACTPDPGQLVCLPRQRPSHGHLAGQQEVGRVNSTLFPLPSPPISHPPCPPRAPDPELCSFTLRGGVHAINS